MKKAILIVLMVVMVATPCLAEVEPEGIFSIEGTLWRVCGIVFATVPPFIGGSCDLIIGFYQGTVYSCDEYGGRCHPYPDYAYIDLLLVSIVYNIFFGKSGVGYDLHILQPSGFGVFASFGCFSGSDYPYHPPFCAFATGIMFKINDNWTPPEVE